MTAGFSDVFSSFYGLYFIIVHGRKKSRISYHSYFFSLLSRQVCNKQLLQLLQFLHLSQTCQITIVFNLKGQITIVFITNMLRFVSTLLWSCFPHRFESALVKPLMKSKTAAGHCTRLVWTYSCACDSGYCGRFIAAVTTISRGMNVKLFGEFLTFFILCLFNAGASVFHWIFLFEFVSSARI